MSLKAKVSTRAKADLQAHADYISRDSIDAALRLFDAAEQTYALLRAMPGIGTRCEFKHKSIANLRRFQLDGFPNHVIYYRVVGNRVHIVRLLHAAQNRERILRTGD